MSYLEAVRKGWRWIKWRDEYTTTISKRPERRGMGNPGTADSTAQTRRQTAQSQDAGSPEWDFLPAQKRLSVADAAQGVPEVENGARLLQQMEQGWHLAAAQ